jgi:phosphocarrier protein FPr
MDQDLQHPAASATGWSERIVTVGIDEGLHARPAAQLVKLAKRFEAEVELCRGASAASAKSAVKIMLLAVKAEETLVLRARGCDAARALAELSEFLRGDGVPATASGMLAQPDKAAEPEAAPEGALRGQPASEGLVLGPAFAFFPPVIHPPHHRIAEPARGPELARYRAGRDAAVANLQAGCGEASREIAEALIEVAHDEALTAEIEQEIAAGRDAVTAVIEAGLALAGRLEVLGDGYLSARAEDIRGITRNIALALLGESDCSLAEIPAGAIILAEELNAWDLAKAPMDRIGGIACARGAASAHAAIMARAHGIPAAYGFAGLERIATGTPLGLDGGTGMLFVEPDAATRGRIEATIAAAKAARAELTIYRDVAPRTLDGVAVEIGANLGSIAEIAAAREAGAMGVGLFRTELLFMAKHRLLSEDEQTAAYSELARAFHPFKVVIRTLDVGGDKPIPGLEIPREDNPFLGWRGIRVLLERPDVFKPQLKALLRAAVHGNVQAMLPMVCEPEEIRRTRALMAECAAELAAAGIAYAEPELGIMMETPAAVLLAEALAREAAFFSIGTNDLTQYIMAADRLNPRVAALNRAEHPAVARAVAMICAAAANAGIPVSLCGEAAAKPALVPGFVRAGITKLSMSAAAIPGTKRLVQGMRAG